MHEAGQLVAVQNHAAATGLAEHHVVNVFFKRVVLVVKRNEGVALRIRDWQIGRLADWAARWRHSDGFLPAVLPKAHVAFCRKTVMRLIEIGKTAFYRWKKIRSGLLFIHFASGDFLNQAIMIFSAVR